MGLSVGGIVGPIRLLRRPLPFVSIFQCSLLSLCLDCAWLSLNIDLRHWHDRRSSSFLCASSAGLLSTLLPCTSLSSPRVLGSHSLAVFFMGSWVPFPGCFPLLFIILQLIDLRVHEVFDADPHVVRYFWWHHYSHLCLFGADHCMSLLRLCIHLDCRR